MSGPVVYPIPFSLIPNPYSFTALSAVRWPFASTSFLASFRDRPPVFNNLTAWLVVFNIFSFAAFPFPFRFAMAGKDSCIVAAGCPKIRQVPQGSRTF
jgi:hypothetical protein